MGFELPKLLDVLAARALIDKGINGVAVLGVTTASILQHTADIFDDLTPTAKDVAAIHLAETSSLEPVRSQDAAMELADIHHLGRADIAQLLNDAEQIGFVDVERIGPDDTLLFNGNLFRRETTKKIKSVLGTLNNEERSKLTAFTEELKVKACVSVEYAKTQLGDILFNKVSAIGLFDINVVSNTKENVGFLTLPSAFSKYSSSMVEDAFDLAKAFVSSITYGMTKSPHSRGKIQMVDALLNALVNGQSVGPVPAIGEDYKILELKGVVEVHQGTKNGRYGPMMSLLKKEVGELALQAIRHGDVSEHSLLSLPSAAVTRFCGPEHNREKLRRKQIQFSPKATNDMLAVLRTGGGM